MVVILKDTRVITRPSFILDLWPVRGGEVTSSCNWELSPLNTFIQLSSRSSIGWLPIIHSWASDVPKATRVSLVVQLYRFLLVTKTPFILGKHWRVFALCIVKGNQTQQARARYNLAWGQLFSYCKIDRFFEQLANRVLKSIPPRCAYPDSKYIAGRIFANSPKNSSNLYPNDVGNILGKMSNDLRSVEL